RGGGSAGREGRIAVDGAGVADLDTAVVVNGLAAVHGLAGGDLLARGIVQARVIAGCDNAVEGHGAGRSRDGTVGVDIEDEWAGLAVDGNDRSGAAEGERVDFLVGREEGAVDENAAVDEVEPPVTRTDIHAGHYRPCRWLARIWYRGQHGREHLAEAAQQRIAGAAGRQPARGDAAAHGQLLR